MAASSSRKSSSRTSDPSKSADPAAITALEQSASSALAELCQRFPDLHPDRPAIIGVSGGRDSVALFHFLVSQGWRKLIVAHFNHRLRGRESGQDAAFVRRLADRHRLTVAVQSEDIAAFAADAKLSLETAARTRRDAFFQSVCATHYTRFVFLAHHLEDNAETILGNLCRGAGLAGAGGMENSGQFASGLVKLRPLLAVSRSEVDACISSKKLAFREDSSNKSADHRRNRLRHEVIPLLNKVLLRDVSPLLTRFGSLAKRDDECLEQLAAHYIQDLQLLLPDGALKLTSSFRSLHPALRSRILKQWLINHCKLSGITNREIESAMSVMETANPPKANLPADRWLRRRAGKLFVEGK